MDAGLLSATVPVDGERWTRRRPSVALVDLVAQDVRIRRRDPRRAAQEQQLMSEEIVPGDNGSELKDRNVRDSRPPLEQPPCHPTARERVASLAFVMQPAGDTRLRWWRQQRVERS